MCANLCADVHKPFCSKRCADLDLYNWLNESYRIPGEEEDLAEDISIDD